MSALEVKFVKTAWWKAIYLHHTAVCLCLGATMGLELGRINEEDFVRLSMCLDAFSSISSSALARQLQATSKKGVT